MESYDIEGPHVKMIARGSYRSHAHTAGRAILRQTSQPFCHYSHHDYESLISEWINTH